MSAAGAGAGAMAGAGAGARIDRHGDADARERNAREKISRAGNFLSRGKNLSRAKVFVARKSFVTCVFTSTFVERPEHLIKPIKNYTFRKRILSKIWGAELS